MRLKPREFNAAFSLLVALGMTSGCGEDPVSSGPPGDFDSAGNAALPTGGSKPFGTGGTPALTGGVSNLTGGTSFGTGGTKATGGASGTGGTSSLGGTSGGKGGSLSTGGKGGSLSTGGKSGTGGAGGRGGSSMGGNAGGSGGGATVAFSEIGKIIEARCSACHKGTMPILQNNTMLRATLTTFKAPDCGNLLVTPNDPSKSAIIQLVSKQCGATSMPLGCATTPCIPQAEVTTITNWINAGAPP